MGIPDNSQLEKEVKELVHDIRTGSARYLLNGKSKVPTAAAVITVIVLILQAVGNIYYFAAKAPTTEWVDQRIDEKILNAPITRGADMKLSNLSFRVDSNERGVSEMKSDVKDIKNQLTEIKVMIGVQMQKGLTR